MAIAVAEMPQGLTPEQQLEWYRTQNAHLIQHIQSNTRTQALGCTVGEKGGVVVRGFGRFPVTLYQEQWERLVGAADDEADLGFVPALKAFIREHRDELKRKMVG